MEKDRDRKSTPPTEIENDMEKKLPSTLNKTMTSSRHDTSDSSSDSSENEDEMKKLPVGMGISNTNISKHARSTKKTKSSEEERRARRRASNRRSDLRVRNRRQKLIEELQRKIEFFFKDNTLLRQQNNQLESKLESVLSENRLLRAGALSPGNADNTVTTLPDVSAGDRQQLVDDKAPRSSSTGPSHVPTRIAALPLAVVDSSRTCPEFVNESALRVETSSVVGTASQQATSLPEVSNHEYGPNSEQQRQLVAAHVGLSGAVAGINPSNNYVQLQQLALLMVFALLRRPDDVQLQQHAQLILAALSGQPVSIDSNDLLVRMLNALSENASLPPRDDQPN